MVSLSRNSQNSTFAQYMPGRRFIASLVAAEAFALDGAFDLFLGATAMLAM